MPASLTALLYLVAAVLFILALRGLSSPVSSRRGNQFGMAGIAIAVLATLAQSGMTFGGVVLIVLAVAASCSGPSAPASTTTRWRWRTPW